MASPQTATMECTTPPPTTMECTTPPPTTMECTTLPPLPDSPDLPTMEALQVAPTQKLKKPTS